MSQEFDLEAYMTRINYRFEDLTGKIQMLNYKVETLTLQVQRLAEALDIQLPYKQDEGERPR